MDDLASAIDWSSVSTPRPLLTLLMMQYSGQAGRALLAVRELLNGISHHRDIAETLLVDAASVADCLCPSPSRRKRLRQAFPNRGTDLRYVLGMQDKPPAGLDAIRNDLVHLDERMEELYLDDPGLSLIAWSDHPPEDPRTRVYLAFYKERRVIHSLGRELDLLALEEWLRLIMANTSRVFLEVAAPD